MRIYIIIILLGVAFDTKSQTAMVKGVVSYFFNDYQGDKPDLGAKAYLIDSTKALFLNRRSVDSFVNGRFASSIYTSYAQMALTYESLMRKYERKRRYRNEYEEARTKYYERVKERDHYFEEMKRYGVETSQKFSDLDARVFDMLLSVNSGNSLIATIDATGSYSFTTKPGTYYVYIVSKNRTTLSITEASGKIFFKKITLKEGDVVDVSYNFDLY